METDRVLTELMVEGDIQEGQETHPAVVRMMEDILAHGEVHATFADLEAAVEVRQGTATFDFEGEVVTIEDGITQHSFSMAQLVNWEKPMGVFESG